MIFISCVVSALSYLHSIIWIVPSLLPLLANVFKDFSMVKIKIIVMTCTQKHLTYVLLACHFL